MKPLKILMFAGYFNPYRGGIAKSIHGLASELVKRGHSVTVVTPHVVGGPEKETLDGIKVYRLPGWDLLGKTYPVLLPTPKTLRALWKLWREKYDVVHTHTRFFMTSIWGMKFAWLTRTPRVHTEHGSSHSIVPNPFIALTAKLIDHTLGYLVVRLAKRNVGVSKAAAKFLKHLGAKHISNIPNGIEPIPSISTHDRNELKKKWSLKPEDRILLFVGRLVYAKGVQDVLPGLRTLLTIEPNLKFLVVGDGAYRNEIKSAVRSLGLESCVKFSGSVKPEEVHEFLQMADWVVNPSHSEGLPYSVLEAAMAGLPMVATDVGGTDEIIEDEVSGLLVPAQNSTALGQALTILLEEPEKAESYGKHAHEYAQKTFRWPIVADSYVDLFRKVV